KVGKSESDNKVVILSEGIPLSRRISSPSQKSESQGSENKEVIQNAEEVNSDGVEVREIAKEVKPEGDEPKYLSKDDLRKLLDEFKDDTPPLKSEARESDNKVVILSEGIPLSRRISSPSQEAENLKSVSKPKPLPKPKAYPPLRAVVETSHLKGEEAIEHVIEIKPRDPKNSLPAKSVTHALAATVPVISGSMLSDSEKAEAMHHENALKKSDVIDNAEFKKRLEEKVNKALGPVIEVFKKKRIAKKVFAEVARAHVRGVREPLRTEQLLRDKHGISGADLDTVMLALESARKIHEEGYRKEQEVRGKSSNIQDDSETSAQSVQAREMDLLNNRHAVTTGKTLDKLTDTPAPNAQVSAARTKLEELQAQEGKIDQEKLRKAKNLPTKARAKLTVQSAPPQAVGIIQDVKFVPKLMGPVEVLGAMTPEEFRRFASDPVESAQKIKDKIALLEASAYEERVRGIKAWRNSPINKLYLVMSNEALTGGVTIAEIATKRRNSGDESLSPAEISALISLNSSLKF
ncbi:MAG: hypothetical protein Q8P30_00050, partial [Candidatus Uhrbacteria bacterium]|nr:hypothetical protein [Candidatus Uhrbacteria bacterium]